MIYKLLKKLIDSNNYIYDDILNKMDVFLLGNRITTEEYEELKNLLDSKK